MRACSHKGCPWTAHVSSPKGECATHWFAGRDCPETISLETRRHAKEELYTLRAAKEHKP